MFHDVLSFYPDESSLILKTKKSLFIPEYNAITYGHFYHDKFS